MATTTTHMKEELHSAIRQRQVLGSERSTPEANARQKREGSLYKVDMKAELSMHRKTTDMQGST